MKKASKTWKYVIAVFGTLVVIGLWRGCSDRALEKKSTVEMEQLWNETTAEINRMKEDEIAKRAAEDKMMEDFKAADTKRFLEERAAQDKAAKVQAELDAAKQRAYKLRTTIRQKADIWNRGLSLEADEYRDAKTKLNLNAKVCAKVEAKSSYTAEAFYKVFGRPDTKIRDAGETYFRYECKDGVISLGPIQKGRLAIQSRWDSGYSYVQVGTAQGTGGRHIAPSHLINKAYPQLLKSKTKDEVKKMADVWNRGIDSEIARLRYARTEVEAEFEAKYQAETKYTLDRFYQVFGEPDHKKPHLLAGSQDYFYYKYKDGIIEIQLDSGYWRPYNCVSIGSINIVDNIPIAQLRLADESSPPRWKDKTVAEIQQIASDWQFGNISETKTEGKSFNLSVETFYKVFGEPEVLRFVHTWGSGYYYFGYRCKDGVVQFKIPRKDFDEEDLVHLVDVSVYQPSEQILKDKTIDEVRKIASDWNGRGVNQSRSLLAFYKVFGEPDSEAKISRYDFYFGYRCRDGMVELRVYRKHFNDKDVHYIRRVNIY